MFDGRVVSVALTNVAAHRSACVPQGVTQLAPPGTVRVRDLAGVAQHGGRIARHSEAAQDVGAAVAKHHPRHVLAGFGPGGLGER